MKYSPEVTIPYIRVAEISGRNFGQNFGQNFKQIFGHNKFWHIFRAEFRESIRESVRAEYFAGPLGVAEFRAGISGRPPEI